LVLLKISFLGGVVAKWKVLPAGFFVLGFIGLYDPWCFAIPYESTIGCLPTMELSYLQII